MVRYGEPPSTPMSNVVNLGRARKRKQQAAQKQRADENAIRHGRTKAEKTRERMEQTRLRARVDGARLEPAPAPAHGDGEAPNDETTDETTDETGEEPEAPPTL